MDDNKAIIDSLGKKVLRLITDNQLLRSELNDTVADRNRILIEKREAETEIKRLNRRVETLETAGGLIGNQADSRIARLRVNRLLREIDKCLALMNK